MPAYNENHSFPERVQLQDFSDSPFTLNTHPSAWKELSISESKNDDADLILLGIASGHLQELLWVKDTLRQNRKIFWLEAPETLAQLHKHNFLLPPQEPSWIQITPEYLQNSSLLGKKIFFYEPGRRLAPDFWGPIISHLSIKKYEKTNLYNKSPKSSLVWLPGNARQLLHLELQEALKNNGLEKIISELPLAPDYPSLEKIWQEQIPDFILSINFRGLDSEGQIFELCQALNIPIAIWLVDNPWHLLSAIRLPWWKKANIFVSDQSFVTSLQNCGARHVSHCPLATAPHMCMDSINKNNSQALFIGRSIFPAQKKFFGSLQVSNEIEFEIDTFLEQKGHYPDYHWWEKKFQEKSWPGKGGRKAGFYADYFSARNRARWLKKAAAINIKIIGDEGWKELLPGCTIEKQVDYYGSLPNIYQKSDVVLNVTSLLLPESLNQRHFDVWAAGSMLLTDISKGLNIFPADLTSPIKLNKPEEFTEKYTFWQKHQNSRIELIQAWKEHLKSQHTYAHRIEFIRKEIATSPKN